MIYEVTVPAFRKALRNLSAVLAKGEAHAQAKKFDVGVLLNARLAPDQFPLIRQVQIMCDTAKLGVARLSGKDAPVHEDKETTMAELQARIQSVLAYLEGFSERDFVGAEDRRITQPRWEGKWITGSEYAHEHALPNLYFHFTTAYSILRHNGVEVGKKDYLGAMPYKN